MNKGARCIFLVFVACAISANASPSVTVERLTFDEAIKNPSKYDGHAISVVGVAQVNQDRFTMYRDEAAAQKVDLKHAIYVLQRSPGPDYTNLNRFWVKVVGTMNADLHGPFGFGYPCGILLERASLLRRAKSKLWLSDFGEFENATSAVMKAQLSSTHGGAKFALGPFGKNTVALHRDTTVTVSTKLDRRLFKASLLIPSRTGRDDEPEDRTFRYVLTAKGIALR